MMLKCLNLVRTRVTQLLRPPMEQQLMLADNPISPVCEARPMEPPPSPDP